MTVDKTFVALKAFILNPEGKVLLLQENSKTYADGTNAGKWELPGGRLTPGEHFYDGLVREVKEETALEVVLGRPFMVGEWFPKVRGEQWHIVATFFVCQAKTADVTLGEDHNQFTWIKPEDYALFTNYAAYIKESFEAYLALESASKP